MSSSLLLIQEKEAPSRTLASMIWVVIHRGPDRLWPTFWDARTSSRLQGTTPELGNYASTLNFIWKLEQHCEIPYRHKEMAMHIV